MHSFGKNKIKEAASHVSPVYEHGGRVGPDGLQVGHCVPLIDVALLRVDAALIERHPCESDAPWEVVESAWHLTRLVENLQGRPAETPDRKRSKRHAWNKRSEAAKRCWFWCDGTFLPATNFLKIAVIFTQLYDSDIVMLPYGGF